MVNTSSESDEVEMVEVVDPEYVFEVDPHQAAPQGVPCPTCGCPVESLDRFCPACGAASSNSLAPPLPSERGERPAEQAPTEPEAPERRRFRCEGCSAEVQIDPDQRSYACPFCDSTYVIELPPDESGRQAPEFVIGFNVTPEQAQKAFHGWLAEGSWFHPSDLKSAKVVEKMKGVYLPFWSFSMLGQSNWSATIGEYWYRTETYTTRDSKGRTVRRTRRVRETEWWSLSGRHHRYYSGYLISGSRGLPQRQANRIKPFQLAGLKRYEPYYLAGWVAEEYTVDRETAQKESEAVFAQWERSNVGAFMPGDTHRNLQVSTTFSSPQSDLCLVPVYLLTYRYREKKYQFLLNGQTGKLAGEKPKSAVRIGIAIGVGVAVVIAAILLFGILAS